MMKKKYLLTPGPTPIPDTVLAALSQPIIHHRTVEFEKVLERIRAALKYLYQTQQEVIILSATGTGAMDAAVSNLFKKNDSVIVINAGKFGERWTQISRAYGLEPIEIVLPPGESLKPEILTQTVKAYPQAKAILFQACETSTGAQLPSREICAIGKKAGMLTVCDGITACGVFPLPMDEWGIDVLITGSQKALMIPPGLAFIALSDTAWEATTKSDLPRFYFDLRQEKKALLKNQSAWTPAISLLQGLEVSLKMIQDEGLPEVFKRHDLLARATRNAVKALRLEILAAQAPSPSVTAVKVPPTLSKGEQIPKLMRDKYGVTIAGGQDELSGKIFRLSHFGNCGQFDVIIAISALELTLHDLGYKLEFGKGVGAALRTFSEG